MYNFADIVDEFGAKAFDREQIIGGGWVRANDPEGDRGGGPDIAVEQGIHVGGRNVTDEEGSRGEGRMWGSFVLLEQERGRDPDVFGLCDFVHSRENAQAEKFMFGSIGGDFIKGLDKDFLSRRFLPGLEHWIVDVVIYGGWGGVVDYRHGCSSEFGERVAG